MNKVNTKSLWKLSALGAGILAATVAAAGVIPALAVQEESRPATETKQRTEFRGRLPMFYSRVVTPEQREQIYAIQRKYQKQIDELTAQLRAVQAQRDEEIHAVLTPEQQKQIATWMEELQKRRAAARAKAADQGSDVTDEPMEEEPPADTAGRARGGQNP
ncbi:MAG: hypothetical protein KatS3mg110_1876 [Pirellulaceae bacterium]|nr:MAG: hypothetical protein KatS3mg110_1876 [Pirellulaceae bacterium]